MPLVVDFQGVSKAPGQPRDRFSDPTRRAKAAYARGLKSRPGGPIGPQHLKDLLTSYRVPIQGNSPEVQLMPHPALAVFTGNSPDEILAMGGSASWVLDRNKPPT
jgi:hypothetical protein